MSARSVTPRMTLLALVLGTMTTVAIAWVAMFIPHGEHGYGPPAASELGVVLDETGEYPRYLQLWEGRNAMHHVVSFWWMQISGQSLMFSQPYDYESRMVDLDALANHMRPDSLGDIVMQSWYRETGWPLKALTCAVHWKVQIRNEDIIYRVEGGIQLPRDSDFQPRALPFTPVWPGFAVNVLLFSALWFALFRSGGAWRIRRRTRQNRCIHCGYSRIGIAANSKCPECGRQS
jgi:hypothetical protein